jgi:hypothetical protein
MVNRRLPEKAASTTLNKYRSPLAKPGGVRISKASTLTMVTALSNCNRLGGSMRRERCARERIFPVISLFSSGQTTWCHSSID